MGRGRSLSISRKKDLCDCRARLIVCRALLVRPRGATLATNFLSLIIPFLVPCIFDFPL